MLLLPPLPHAQVGGAVLPVGGVVRVRLLGALTMVDDNQTDWKMLVVNVKVRVCAVLGRVRWASSRVRGALA